jgi:hypothetical protein
VPANSTATKDFVGLGFVNPDTGPYDVRLNLELGSAAFRRSVSLADGHDVTQILSSSEPIPFIDRPGAHSHESIPILLFDDSNFLALYHSQLTAEQRHALYVPNIDFQKKKKNTPD